METKFQTSFIPKKPIVAESTTHVATSSSISLFTVFAVIVFIASIAGAGGVFAYKSILLKKQADYQATLAQNKNEFNQTLIQTLQKANAKIDLSSSLLNNHVDATQIFDILGQLTAENVRFSNLDYTAGTVGGKSGITVNMKGMGTSFKDIAFQSDVFGKAMNFGRNVNLKNPVLSDLNLDANGNVAFSFTTTIDISNALYSKSVETALNGGIPPTVPANGTNTITN